MASSATLKSNYSWEASSSVLGKIIISFPRDNGDITDGSILRLYQVGDDVRKLASFYL